MIASFKRDKGALSMNFREKVILERQGKTGSVANDNEVSSYHSFGIENLRNLPACIDFRLMSGDRYALPYSLITEINFNKSHGIEIKSASKSVYIEGINLNRLYEYMATFQVKYINMNHEKEADKSKPRIENITFKPL